MSRRVLALNTNGVKSLLSGNLHEAILFFRHAIECVKSGVTANGSTSSHPCEVKISAVEELALTRWPLHALNVSQILEVSPHNMFDIFQHAFSLPKIDCAENLQTEVSIVLFYNLGLAHHLSGLTRPPTSCQNGHLQEAIRFYKLALTLFRSSEELVFDNSCCALMLGVISNLGHLFSHFWVLREAKSCRRHLQELLDRGVALGLSEEEGEFFSVTLTQSAAHTLTLAPAA